jgi:hypothetical protein
MTGKAAACKPFVAVAADETRAFRGNAKRVETIPPQILGSTD